MTPTDRLLVKILKSAVRDYMRDKQIVSVRIFFTSEWFEQIMAHFSAEPDSFLDGVTYYKALYLKRKLKHGRKQYETASM